MRLHLLLLLVLISAFIVHAQETGPLEMPGGDSIPYIYELPMDINAVDTPDDDGTSITVNWCADDSFATYMTDVHRVSGGIDTVVGAGIMASRGSFMDNSVNQGDEFKYYVRLYKGNKQVKSPLTQSVRASGQWFNMSRLDSFIALLIIAGSFVWYINMAKKGKEFYIRKISGLDAVEEAVGRSTEMGKPIMYILGIGYVTDIPTIAGLTILGRVAKKAAEYDTRILVPSYDPVVMTTAQEVVKESFTEAGRPDTYRKEDTMYITQDQFGYAAGVDGMMMREKPGAIFLQGLFFAEALILAETGYSIGAIQIAGTTETAQLPFFVAACDYTLIGEEMMAASVYLEREPLMLGSLIAEDLIKLLIVLILIIGFVFGILGPGFGIGFFNSAFEWLINII